MLHITSLEDGLELFKALGSDIRVQIIKLLLEEKQMSMNQLAQKLNITNGALTGHVKKLEECGILSTSSDSSEGHGNQKTCSVILDRILIDFEKPVDYSTQYKTSLKVGHFTNYEVLPTCGLADANSVVGELDDIRYFNHPDRFNAEIVWLTQGFLEYTVPNLIPSNQKITQISFSLEISSEAPGVDSNWPSDISFRINDTLIGSWTSPGDFGDVRGIFTPDWWFPNWNQYGLLKLVVINRRGTFIDGFKISDVTTDTLKLDSNSSINFKIGVDKDAQHVGGLTIFGKQFGNYGQDIEVSISYEPLNKSVD